MSRELLNLIDDVKEKLIDNEYKQIVERIKPITNIVIIQKEYSVRLGYNLYTRKPRLERVLNDVSCFKIKSSLNCNTCFLCLLKQFRYVSNVVYHTLKIAFGSDLTFHEYDNDEEITIILNTDDEEITIPVLLDYTYDVYLVN